MHQGSQSIWQKWGGSFEGILLFMFGCYMVGLVQGGDYWLLLNPKFKWLTGSAGYVLLLIGLVATFYPNPPKVSRSICFVVLFAIVSLVHSPDNPLFAGSSLSEVDLPLGKSSAAVELPSRVIKDEREYIRINLGELYDICEAGTAEQLQQRYLVRGMLQRNDKIAPLGQFLILRGAVSCCLADAVAVGFRFNSGHVAEYTDGQWLNLYISLDDLSSPAESLEYLGLKGIFYTNINQQYLLKVEHVEKQSPPKIPAMFEFRNKEPYAY